MLSGSYAESDVTFLLEPLSMELTSVADKEAAIQSGRRHYSEMLSPESPPSPRYLELFEAAMDRNLARFAGDVLELAAMIDRARPSAEITLLSLARAGAPVGVILARLLRARFGRSVAHYSISIVRDRGIDANALRYVLSRHAHDSVVFVDGWTGKGVIARELSRSLDAFRDTTGVTLDPGLAAVSDLCGIAAHAPSHDDYLVPSSILGGVVSGLVSRSVLNEHVRPDGFHGCVRLDHLAAHDRSVWLVDRVVEATRTLAPRTPRPRAPAETFRARAAYVDAVARAHDVDTLLVKPGIGEATRVLLRRVPGVVLVADASDPDTAHLVLLAKEKGVVLREDPAMPYRAVSVTQKVRA